MISEELRIKGQLAKKAAYQLGLMNSQEKDKALEMMAQGLEENIQDILLSNQKDMEKARDKGLSKPFR